MAWNDKYWDIISNLYWTPRYLGLKSISRERWHVEGDRVWIPSELIANTSGPLYSRSRTFSETKLYLNRQEEILNHIFNLVFSIAGDEVISRLLCQPLRISDQGPFESIGREIGLRYGWRRKCYTAGRLLCQSVFTCRRRAQIGIEFMARAGRQICRTNNLGRSF